MCGGAGARIVLQILSTATLRTRASTDTQKSRTVHRTQEERPAVTESALPRFFIRPQVGEEAHFSGTKL